MSADFDVDSQMEELQVRLQNTSDVAVETRYALEGVEETKNSSNDDVGDDCKTKTFYTI